MDRKRLRAWFATHGITLEENFATALRNYAKAYGRKNGLTIDAVYKKIGVSKQSVSYWRVNPGRTQTKKILNKPLFA